MLAAMSATNHPEPTNEALWLQPPPAGPGVLPVPGQQVVPLGGATVPTVATNPSRSGDKTSFTLAIVSLGVGIPLTGIAAGASGSLGLVISWAGIVGVNFVYAWSRRR